MSQILEKATAEVASLQIQAESARQQLRLKDSEHEEPGEELGTCKEELEQLKVRLQDFKAWDIGDIDANAGYGAQPSTFGFVEWFNLDEASGVEERSQPPVMSSRDTPFKTYAPIRVYATIRALPTMQLVSPLE